MFPRRTPLVLALVAALAAPLSASADTTFTFTGHGYGHGVGMGQYGAQGYAQQGWTHQQILAHYYQGTTLGPSDVTQVRVLLQEKLTQASASAPGGVIAADEGGSASLAIAGPAVVTVRKDASGVSLLDATGKALASGWTGPVSLAATGGGPIDARRHRAQRRPRGALSRATARARGHRRPGGRERRVARELPARRRRQRDAVQLEARGARGAGDRRAHVCGRDAQARDQRRTTSIPTSAARSTAAWRGRARHPRPPSRRPPGRSCSTQGRPIVTYFSSSSGGRTAAVQESLPGVDPVSYLVSVEDPYDSISPYHDWTLSLSDRDLSQKAVYPGLVTSLHVDAYASGRVQSVTLNGNAGPVVLSASLVRKRLGPAFDVVHRDTGGTCPERPRRHHAAFARRAQSRPAHGRRAAGDRNPPGRR